MSQNNGLAQFVEASVNLIKGLAVTLVNWRRPRVTIQYPFKEKLAISPRWRGRMVQLRDEATGRLRCTACQACVKACPANVITVEGDDNKGRERRAKSYQWLEYRCMFCNLCVEACPFNAIVLSPETDAPVYAKEELVWELERLLEPWSPKAAEGVSHD